MRTAKSDEVTHLFVMILQVWKSSSANETAKTVRNKANLRQTIARAVMTDMSIDLLCQSHTHFSNIALRIILIVLTHEEHNFWKDQSDIVLDHFHILRISLEAMDENPQVNSVLIIFWQLTLNLLLLSLNSQFLNVSDEAFLEDNGLKVLQVSQSLLCLELL